MLVMAEVSFGFSPSPSNDSVFLSRSQYLSFAGSNWEINWSGVELVHIAPKVTIFSGSFFQDQRLYFVTKYLYDTPLGRIVVGRTDRRPLGHFHI
jgi:hypothetical protein